MQITREGQHQDVESPASAVTGHNPKTVCDLYRLKLSQAANFLSMAGDTNFPEPLRLHFRERAHRLEGDATNLAHCAAWFGDLPLSELLSDDVAVQFNDMSCGYCNPWVRGLAAIKSAADGPADVLPEPRRSSAPSTRPFPPVS